jgi:SSS family solute:Na+ symporter
LVVAAMLAAAMQTCSAALNSTATLVAYDIVKRYWPMTSDHRLVVVGKVTTVVGTIFAIVSSPIFGQKDTVFQALTDLICYVAPPITAVFLLGVFWKGATARSAYLALVLGNVTGIAIFFLDLFQPQTRWGLVVDWHVRVTGVELTSMITSFYLCVLCAAIIVVTSRLSPQPLKDEARLLVWEDWREPLRGETHGRGLGNYRVLSIVVVATFLLLYILFR